MLDGEAILKLAWIGTNRLNFYYCYVLELQCTNNVDCLVSSHTYLFQTLSPLSVSIMWIVLAWYDADALLSKGT